MYLLCTLHVVGIGYIKNFLKGMIVAIMLRDTDGVLKTFIMDFKCELKHYFFPLNFQTKQMRTGFPKEIIGLFNLLT